VLLSALGEGDVHTLRKAGAADALGVAVSRGLVERIGDRLRFTHPLLASTVYQAADDRTRRSCHAALTELVRDRLERAHHLALSDGAFKDRLHAPEYVFGRPGARAAVVPAPS
jgi:hypothetical protein